MTVAVRPPPAAYELGDLAERMVTVACEFACLVRDRGREEVSEFITDLSPGERDALLVVQAAMIPVDVPAAELLAWVTWDEHGRPLPGHRGKRHPVVAPAPVPAPRRTRGRRKPEDVKPCGTFAAYRRHKKHGELVDDECQQAATEQWAADNQARKERAASAVPRQGTTTESEASETRET